MADNEGSDVEDAGDVPIVKSDSDSDFEASGKGRKKRQAKSKGSSNKRRNTGNSAIPRIKKCHQCRQVTDDNPNLVIILWIFKEIGHFSVAVDSHFLFPVMTLPSFFRLITQSKISFIL